MLLIVGFFVAKSAIDAYLRSDGFRQFVARKAGDTLHANAEMAPLTFTGGTVFADGFRAHGGPDAAFADLQIEQIRTEISLRRFFEKVWLVEQFDVQRVRVDVKRPRAEPPLEAAAESFDRPEEPEHQRNGWLLGAGVEIGHATIHDTQFQWKRRRPARHGLRHRTTRRRLADRRPGRPHHLRETPATRRG